MIIIKLNMYEEVTKSLFKSRLKATFIATLMQLKECSNLGTA